MTTKPTRRRVPFQVSIIAVILVVLTLMALSTLTLILAVSDRSSQATAEALFRASGSLARERVAARFRVAQDLAGSAVGVPGIETVPAGTGREHPLVPYFAVALQGMSELYSVYAGYEGGEFLQLISADRAGMVALSHDAPPQTALILRAISGGGTGTTAPRRQYWTFFGPSGEVLGERIETEPGYDPRLRPWFSRAVAAVGQERAVLSEPYTFDSLQQPGITASRSVNNGAQVLGVDLTLAALQDFAAAERISDGGGLALLDPEQRILAISPAIAELAAVSPGTSLERIGGVLADTQPGMYRIDDWLVWRDSWPSSDGQRWPVIAAAPVSDFLGPFILLRGQVILVALILLVVAVPLIIWVTGSLTRVLSILAEEAGRISALDFSPGEQIDTPILEFHQLDQGFSRMKGVLNDTLDQLARIIDLNIALSAESDIERLSELILDGARELANADAGSLYLQNPEQTHLVFQIVHTESLGFLQGGTSGNAVTLPPVPLYDDDGKPNLRNVVTATYHRGEAVSIADAYNEQDYDFSGTRKFDAASGFRSTSFLTVPLRPRGGAIIGAIQLINAMDRETGQIIPFSPEIQRFIEALCAGAATALSNRDLVEQQKALFESMIKLIAGAIDAKSPYTGGHCERVPEIAMMLAQEAQNVTEGPLASFTFDSEAELRAFRIGAWLHDAGKVTTPDYVVDKSVKLETICNRIHEVRTRFEVLLRDARINRYEAVLAGQDPREADRILAETEQTLHQEFAFVAECNLGGEFMSDDRIQRLAEIGRRQWLRHFDDSLGLSWEEAERLARARGDDAGAPDGPVQEFLLADKPEHVIPRGPEFERMYDGYGFALPVPPALYNRGELYNLAIRRGTLSEEERFKINEHVMQTIVMLEGMPFPRELKNVPDYAGTHHETLNGEGYPRRLTGEALSIPARIMAIADIYEALTASDRPYKRPKPLSAVVEILHHFKKDGHIDPDLFDLFLTSGLYRRYAEQYLLPEQIDEVDISRFVG